jgi:hypothetical protein
MDWDLLRPAYDLFTYKGFTYQIPRDMHLSKIEQAHKREHEAIDRKIAREQDKALIKEFGLFDNYDLLLKEINRRHHEYPINYDQPIFITRDVFHEISKNDAEARDKAFDPKSLIGDNFKFFGFPLKIVLNT